jgi:tight adherence protein C
VIVAFALRPVHEAEGINRSIAVLRAMTTAPKELTADLDRPFADRVLQPLQARALAIGRRFIGADSAERYRTKLNLAGNPAGWTVDRIISGKVLCAGLGLLLGFAFSLMVGHSFGIRLIFAIGGLVVGFFGPNLYLYQLGYDRADKLQRALPDAIDLMTISVESGLGFDAAVQQVAMNTTGPLAEEFSRVLREMQLGMGRGDALRSFADRTTVVDVKSFVMAMVQADSFGIPIAQVLRVQSSEMRVKRRQRAETRAQQVPVKMTVPLIFCILPCLFAVVLGPAAIQIMHAHLGGK